MGYIEPKTDFKDGDVLHGIDLNASNETIKAGVDNNFDLIQGLETEKQDVINSENKLDYSLLENTPDIPTKTSDLTNDSDFIDSTYHDNSKQDVLTAGEGISIENNVISNTQTSAEWGNVQGDITDQTDLMDALAAKQDVIDSNHKLDYGLLSNTPSIPSKTSDLTNDSGFVDNSYHDNSKQDELVSGTNIKTINNQSILGSGNLSIGGGSGGTSDYDQLENRPQINNVVLTGNKSLSDLGINIPTQLSELSDDSTHRLVTDTEKNKLSGIESGAEVNDIDTIKVNGTSQTITNKEVDITVPTKLSDLNNDNNTVTDANYVHTDNNYTSVEKTKLSGIETGAQVNVNEITVEPDTITDATVLLIEEEDLDFQGLPIASEYTTGDDIAYSPNYLNPLLDDLKNIIKSQYFSRSVTMPSKSTDFWAMGQMSIPQGYTFLGIVAEKGGDLQNWITSFKCANPTDGSSVVANVYSWASSSVTSTISCRALYIRDFNS